MEGFAEILGFSKLYRSKPYGFADQPSFVNAAARIRTTLSPNELLTKLHETERALGKKVIRENGPRVIDLDLLLYEDLVLDTNELQLPHPGILERDFVLRPLLARNLHLGGVRFLRLRVAVRDSRGFRLGVSRSLPVGGCIILNFCRHKFLLC